MLAVFSCHSVQVSFLVSEVLGLMTQVHIPFFFFFFSYEYLCKYNLAFEGIMEVLARTSYLYFHFFFLSSINNIHCLLCYLILYWIIQYIYDLKTSLRGSRGPSVVNKATSLPETRNEEALSYKDAQGHWGSTNKSCRFIMRKPLYF